jgi:fatty acid CoA ligase FadD9
MAADYVLGKTPDERSAFHLAARDALVGGPSEQGGHRLEVLPSEEEPDVLVAQIELPAGCDALWLRLDPPPDTKSPWRETWALRVDLPDTDPVDLHLSAQTARLPLRPEDPTQGTRLQLRLHPRVARDLVALGDPPLGCHPVPVADLAFGRYTRQSSVGEETPELWAQPTQSEAAPWWEIDLGELVHIDRMRLRLPPCDLQRRVHFSLYGFLGVEGKNLLSANAWDLTVPVVGECIDVNVGAEGRYLRVEGLPPEAGGPPASLRPRSLQILGTTLWGESLASTWRRIFALFADRPLFATPPFDTWATYRDVWARILAVSTGLREQLQDACRGASEQAFVGLCSANRSEWAIADVACQLNGFVVVPLAATDPPGVWRHITQQSQLACVVCDAENAEVFAELARDDCESLRLIVTLDAQVDVPAPARSLPWSALEESDPAPFDPAPDEALCTVLYTSGSTGNPKGAVRSVAAFHALMQGYSVVQPPVHLSFQPLSHFSERIMLPIVMAHGGQVGFASKDSNQLFEELGALRPTFLATVPRVFDVLRGRYEHALRTALESAAPEEHEAITEGVRARFRELLGGRLQSVAVGSAPCSEATLEFMRLCFAGSRVSEGYGSTECGSITHNDRVVAGVDVKLIDVPDLGYLTTDVPARGEICVKTPHMISGYLGDPDSTSERFDEDGFFHTGDLGVRDPDGSVRVIGRCKNVIKLAQGEFVAPEAVETTLEACELVDQIYVYADGLQPCVVALVHAHTDALTSGTDPEACVLAALRKTGRSAGLLPFQIPAAVELLAEPLTVANGLCTSSNKVKRRAVEARYADVFERLYASVDPSTRPVSILSAVQSVAKDALGHDVAADADLSGQLGVDSLAGVDFVALLEKRLGREIPLQAFLGAGSLNDLARRLEVNAGAGSTRTIDDARARVHEDLSLEVPVNSELPTATGLAEVFLTGATGFLGIHLLGDLLGKGACVTCLVRAADPDAGLKRLEERAAAAGVDLGDAVAEDRLVALPGDLSEERLGMDEALFADLAARLNLIVHPGAIVNWVMLYGQLRAANVVGTHWLLRLAVGGERLTPVSFVSTISTVPSGKDEAEIHGEDALLSSPYALSKWVAERLVRQAGANGLPVMIHRPSMITGHSETGFSNATDFVNRYLVGVAQLGVYLDEDAPFDMTPVDFVSRSIVGLATTDDAWGKTLHLTNVSRSLSYRALGEALCDAGLKIVPASYDLFRAKLSAACSGEAANALLPLKAFFPAGGFRLGMGPWPCEASDALLTDAGVDLPEPVGSTLVETYVASLRSRGLV